MQNNDNEGTEMNPEEVQKKDKVLHSSSIPSSSTSSDLEEIMKEPLYEFPVSRMDRYEIGSGSSFDWLSKVDETTENLAEQNSDSLLRKDPPVFDKVWAFVRDLKMLYNELDDNLKGLWQTETSFDQVFNLMERLALTQIDFEASGRSSLIDVGYHYTTEINIPSIQKMGLLSQDERQSLGITARFNGAAHGNGIYLGNNPFAFCHNFGKIGILVARLRGREVRSQRGRQWDEDEDADTKTSGFGFQEMVILRSSAQCAPLACFSSSALDIDNDNALGNHNVFVLHICLQNLLDKYFNKGPTSVSKAHPSSSPNLQRKRRRAQRMLEHKKRRTNDAPVPALPMQSSTAQSNQVLQRNQASPIIYPASPMAKPLNSSSNQANHILNVARDSTRHTIPVEALQGFTYA